MNGLIQHRLPSSRQYVYSVLAVTVITCVCFAFSHLVGYRVVALILLFAVSVLAILFDILPVLLAAALSALAWDVLFIPPRFALHVNTAEDTILLCMYFVIATINAVLTYKIRQAEGRARTKEERANSVALYNTVLNSLSHELRTPIAAIIGATDNLQFNQNLTAGNRQQLIEEISKASLRLNQQVENLLNISRLESGHIQPKNDWCDIIELVHEVVKSVEENHGHRRIHISINHHLPLCKTDKDILQQILYNLLNNAAIHTPAGSRIEVSATCHADLLEIMIEDNGGGFGEGQAKDIFSKLSRGKPSSAGSTGLGLSIVKGFTEALGGNVELRKGTTGGAKFILDFPVKTSYFKSTGE